MKIDFDDPKWTAYVLGELNPEERRAIELELEASEDLKAFVEELNIAAFAMKDAMAHDDAMLGLTFQQRNAVRAAAEGISPAPARGWFARPFVWAASGLAAAALIVMVSPSLWRSQPEGTTQMAKGGAPSSPSSNVAAQGSSQAVPAPPPSVAGTNGKVAEKAVGSGKQTDGSPDSTPRPNNVAVQPESILRQSGAAGLAADSARPAEPLRNSRAFTDGPTFTAGSPAPFPPQSMPPQGRGARGGGGGGRGGAVDPVDLFRDRARSDVTVAQPPATVDPIAVGALAPRVPLPSPVDNRPILGGDTTVNLVGDNPFTIIKTPENQTATFSSDVDTGGYSIVRQFINSGQLPPREAVRIEELINYFSYDYPNGSSDHPITANIESASAPWNPEHRLVRIGIRARDVRIGEKPSNLVFLIDVSGSMDPQDRLPLLKSGLRMLVERLTENDRVTIVTYAGTSGIVLPPTNGTRKDVIRQAIDGLRAEGATNGGEGIQTAYDLAASSFIRGGINRVILMTDGDFNVGVTSQSDLVRLIEEKAQTGVFLSVLGVGTGSARDATMEQLADRGNGNYAYLDTANEARKVLLDQMGGTLITVAKDVKLKVEFNPAQVRAYRLIGYEDRVLTSSDFANSRKDAGDIGAGHTVTALFEVVPLGVEVNNFPGVGPLRYQPEVERTAPTVKAAVARELLNLSINYKDPASNKESLIEVPMVDRGQSFENASLDFRFAAAVAEFGMLLRNSQFKGSATWASSIAIAQASRGADKEGYREEFIRLVQQCEQIARIAGR